jgi:ribosomal protein S18 acetylase RimI-like enzyme
MSENLLARSIAARYIPQLVAVHQRSFNGFFLTFLGPKFLAELYQAIVKDPSGIGCMTLNNETVSGFVIGSTQPAGLYGRLLRKRWWQFGWAALPAFLRNPAIFPRLLRAFSMPKQEPPAPNSALLMSIAVDLPFQHQGIGKQLICGFLEEARQHGAQAVHLLTDAENNDGTNHFYQTQGFVIYRTFSTPEKRLMNEYLIYLKNIRS